MSRGLYTRVAVHPALARFHEQGRQSRVEIRPVDPTRSEVPCVRPHEHEVSTWSCNGRHVVRQRTRRLRRTGDGPAPSLPTAPASAPPAAFEGCPSGRAPAPTGAKLGNHAASAAHPGWVEDREPRRVRRPPRLDTNSSVPPARQPIKPRPSHSASASPPTRSTRAHAQRPSLRRSSARLAWLSGCHAHAWAQSRHRVRPVDPRDAARNKWQGAPSTSLAPPHNRDRQARRDSIRAAISLALCRSKLISYSLSILGPGEVAAF